MIASSVLDSLALRPFKGQHRQDGFLLVNGVKGNQIWTQGEKSAQIYSHVSRSTDHDEGIICEMLQFLIPVRPGLFTAIWTSCIKVVVLGRCSEMFAVSWLFLSYLYVVCLHLFSS